MDLTHYPKHNKQKPDMRKSCFRFNKLDQIPYQLIGDLIRKISVKEWIDIYEQSLKIKPRRVNKKNKR